jgi:hypothetical protein
VLRNADTQAITRAARPTTDGAAEGGGDGDWSTLPGASLETTQTQNDLVSGGAAVPVQGRMP